MRHASITMGIEEPLDLPSSLTSASVSAGASSTGNAGPAC